MKKKENKQTSKQTKNTRKQAGKQRNMHKKHQIEQDETTAEGQATDLPIFDLSKAVLQLELSLAAAN